MKGHRPHTSVDLPMSGHRCRPYLVITDLGAPRRPDKESWHVPRASEPLPRDDQAGSRTRHDPAGARASRTIRWRAATGARPGRDQQLRAVGPAGRQRHHQPPPRGVRRYLPSGRLVAELAGRLTDRGWLVLLGGSVAVGDDGLPFGPIVEALRALSRGVEPERIAAAAGASLSELARLVPELASVPDPGPIPSSQADWLQVRIFEGILRLLGRLGDTNPILLIVEDAHWADRSTRDLLAFLARSGRDERLFIVATFRSDELYRRHPLTGWLAEAERQSRVERIDLTRFERDELVEMIGMITGDQLGPSMVDSIARRSDGNAFFAEELVAATESSRSSYDGLPDTLRGLLMARLAATSEDAGHLVEIAAVAGREVEHDVLAEVCGLSDADLSRALHEALDAQLLFVTGADGVERYAFRHALVQEA